MPINSVRSSSSNVPLGNSDAILKEKFAKLAPNEINARIDSCRKKINKLQNQADCLTFSFTKKDHSGLEEIFKCQEGVLQSLDSRITLTASGRGLASYDPSFITERAAKNAIARANSIITRKQREQQFPLRNFL